MSYIAQRDYRRAHEVLDAALSFYPQDSPSAKTTATATQDLLRLILAFVGIFRQLRLKEAVLCAREVKVRWLDTENFDEYNELKVCQVHFATDRRWTSLTFPH